MVDPNLNKEKLWIEPGIGNFGGKSFFFFLKFFFFKLISFHIDRYFGTEEEDDE